MRGAQRYFGIVPRPDAPFAVGQAGEVAASTFSKKVRYQGTYVPYRRLPSPGADGAGTVRQHHQWRGRRREASRLMR